MREDRETKIQALKEAINKKIRAKVGNEPIPFYKSKKCIWIVVEAVPITEDERNHICQYLKDKWLKPEYGIDGHFFTLSKVIFFNKYLIRTRYNYSDE